MAYKLNQEYKNLPQAHHPDKITTDILVFMLQSFFPDYTYLQVQDHSIYSLMINLAHGKYSFSSYCFSAAWLGGISLYRCSML